jgi:hypothetical protein
VTKHKPVQPIVIGQATLPGVCYCCGNPSTHNVPIGVWGLNAELCESCRGTQIHIRGRQGRIVCPTHGTRDIDERPEGQQACQDARRDVVQTAFY